MANICSNELHISCAEEDLPVIKEFMDENFCNPDCSYEEAMGDDSLIEFLFDSKWVFPEEVMNKLLSKLNKRELFSASCLSYEWGNFYCAFNFCDEEGEWHE